MAEAITARILSIGTAVPETRLRQEQVRDFFAAQPGTDRRTARLVHAAFDAAAIDERHTVLAEFTDHGGEFIASDGRLRHPTTADRNRAYTTLAPPLSAEAARKALSDAALPPTVVTHVVTVSCTGFFAPGPDYRLVRDLGLPSTTERYHLGFIGCAAALPALRLAARITRADPVTVVLVVCTELCSLHIRASDDPQQIVAASVFADGAAAVVDRFVGGDRVDRWAVHPGGRSILDRIEKGLGLDPAALLSSREILRENGNTSSATVLFVLRRLLHDAEAPPGSHIAALAFGPGLTVESALLTARGPA